MRFVNTLELSSILAQPQICSSNHLGAMASQRDKGHFEMAKKTFLKVAGFGDITLQCLEKSQRTMPRCMGAVVEANGGHTKY